MFKAQEKIKNRIMLYNKNSQRAIIRNYGSGVIKSYGKVKVDRNTHFNWNVKYPKK